MHVFNCNERIIAFQQIYLILFAVPQDHHLEMPKKGTDFYHW